MLSKPLALIVLILSLVAAAFGGGYLALRTGGLFGVSDEERLEELFAEEEPPANGSTDGAPSGGVPSGGAAGGTAVGGAPRTSGSLPRLPRPGAGGGDPTAPAENASSSSSSMPPAAGAAVRPAEPTFEEVLVPSGQLLDVQLQSPLSSDRAKVEDLVEARITKDVRVGATLAVPAGSKILGSVTIADKGGSIKEAARLGVRFHTLVMIGHPDVPLVIDPLIHEGPSPSGDSKLKIAGGAAAGAALGWLKGGFSGAVTGGAIGGGAGTAARMSEGGKAAELPAGAQARVELRAPLSIIAQVGQ